MAGGGVLLSTSTAAPRPAFGQHDIAAAWEHAAAGAARRRRLALMVLLGVLAAAAAMVLGFLPLVKGSPGVLLPVGIFLLQRLLQWQHDDLIAELKRLGAPPGLLKVTTVAFGNPAVRTPRDLDHYLSLLELGGVDPALLGSGAKRALAAGDAGDD